MGTFTWTATGNGSYEDYTAWNNWVSGDPQVFPGSTNEVVLPKQAKPYTVQTSSSGDAALSLAIGGTVTLAINGSFTIADQAASDLMAGAITVASGQTLHFGGSMDNLGSLTLEGDANLVFDQSSAEGATFSGGGKITLGGSGGNGFYATNGVTVTNVDNTISGGGNIGQGWGFELLNEAAGKIEQTGATGLTLQVGGAGVVNTGLIEALGTGGLTLNTTVDDSGSSNAGTIEAKGVGVAVDLQSAHIIGGSLITASGGVIQTADSGSSIDSSGAPLADKATIDIVDNTTLTMGGAIANAGIINLQSTGDGTALAVDSNNLTLSGGGKVTLSDNSQNAIYAQNYNAGTLTNVDNTISGAGDIGNNGLTLINQAKGVIDGTSDVNTLNINAPSVTNQGLIEGTGSGGTTISDTTVNNTGTLDAASGMLKISFSTVSGTGTVEATGANSDLQLQSATLKGGVVATNATGEIEALNNGSTIDGATLNNAGLISIDDGAQLHLGQGTTINNAGTIALKSTGDWTALVFDTNESLQGGGNVTLSDNSQNYIYGGNGSVTLTNVNNTISGAGQLGNGDLTLINQAAGVIDGTSDDNTLNISTPGGLTNQGLIEGTGTDGTTVFGTVNNTGTIDAAGGTLTLSGTTVSGTGTVEATGKGSHLYLEGAAIKSGIVATDVNGVIATEGGGGSIDNATVNNAGQIWITDNTTLHLGSTVDNTGTIALNSTGDGTSLVVDSSGVTLEGGGKVTLSNNTQNYIDGVSGGATLTNVDNTISGAGQLGNGELTLVNETAGVIDGTSSTNALNINVSGGLTNQGLIEGTGKGGTNIQSTLVKNTGTVEAAGGGALTISGSTIRGAGTVEAVGTGSHLYLQSATLNGGGVLATGVGAVIQTLDQSSVVDGETVNNAGQILIGDNTALTLGSTVDNTGTIALKSTGDGTSIQIDTNDATFEGGGQVVLSDNAQNYIYGQNSGDTLTNVDNTISGSGQLGNGRLTFVNETSGVVNGNGKVGLTVNTGGGALTNQGLIEGTSSGGVTVSGSLVNNTGAIEAAGGHALIQNSTISGSGEVESLDKGVLSLQSAVLDGGSLVTDATSTIQTLDGGTVIDNVAVTNAGKINILDNTGLTLGSTVDNSGTISLGSTGDGTAIVIDSNGATLEGGGKVTLSNDSQNYIYGQDSGDTLTNVDNSISGAGQLGNGQLTFVNEAAGVVEATSTSNALVLNTGDLTVSNAGLLEAGSGATLLIDSAVANTGLIEAKGGTVTVDGAVTGAGTATITNAGQIEFADASSAAVGFTGATGKLILDDSQQFTGSIAGMSPSRSGAVVDLTDISFATATESYTGTKTSGVLTITDGSHTANLTMIGNYTLASFTFSNDGSGGVQFSDPAASHNAHHDLLFT